nr:reverse transcriptase domain-containing protein [Tanacetum cinerariifolium]
MSTMANVTLIIAIVKNASVKEKMLKETDTVPKASFLDFCKEPYKDILLIILNRTRHDKRKEVQTRLDFRESPNKVRRERENSLNSWTRNSPIRFHHERSRTRGQERHDDRSVFNHLSHRKKSRVWFDELPPEGIDGYKGLKAAFLAYFMQQKKYVKDLVEIHNIKQRDGETIEEFMEHFKIKTERMKGASEYSRIFEFMHGVNNHELTKYLNEHVPKTVEEMMTATMAFIRGKTVATFKKKVHTPWKSHDQSKRHTSERRSNFQNQTKDGDQQKTGKKDAPVKHKAKTIYMIRSWQRVMRTKVTRSFSRIKKIMFPQLIVNKGIEGPLVIEAKISGHAVHRIYVDGGSYMEEYHDRLPSINSISESDIPPLDRKKGAGPETRQGNPSRGVAEGMFLGHMISPEGIKPCQDKMKAVLQLLSPWKIKECGFDDRKGHSLDTGLFLEPSAASSRAKLYSNGKASPDASLRSQKVTQILPSASHWEHNITYRPWTSVKGQILSDFLVEKQDDAPPEASVIETSKEPWTMFTDRSSCVDGSGDGLILTSPEGTEFTYALRFQFTASNNEAEYEALIAGLRITMQMGVRNVHVNADSKLLENQVLRTYVAKYENMIKYLEKGKSLISGFANFSISQVLRSKNKKADALSKIASTSFAHLSKLVLVEVLKEKSLQEREIATVVEEEGTTWMTLIIEYFRDKILPDNRKEARKLRIKAKQYELLEGIPYRRSFLKPWLRCVRPLQADYVIREIHEGSCNCQIHRPVPRHPQQLLTPIMAPWPYKWGIDIAGPFLECLGKVMFLIVAMDYFTKWVEAKTMATITRSQVKKFVWDNIVCHFGLLEEIVSNNSKQFSSNPFKDWSLGEGIKAHLSEGNKNWLEELPRILWAHRTMIKSSNDDTLFSLTYGTEAVIPAEIRMPTYSTTVMDAVHNDEELRLNLDLHEERRERSAIREAKAKLKMTKYYNARVRGPYEVTEALGDGAYKLRSTNGTVLLRTWNFDNLKKCYL